MMRGGQVWETPLRSGHNLMEVGIWGRLSRWGEIVKEEGDISRNKKFGTRLRISPERADWLSNEDLTTHFTNE